MTSTSFRAWCHHCRRCRRKAIVSPTGYHGCQLMPTKNTQYCTKSNRAIWYGARATKHSNFRTKLRGVVMNEFN